MKETHKTLLYHLKGWKHPFYNGKGKKKNDEKKEEEDNGFLKGSRTVKNGSNPSIYKALRGNENKKEEEDIRQQNPTMFQDLPVHGTMPPG